MSSKLILGDCLEKMKNISDKSIDLILADPPYGTTNCKWDSVIDLDLMWKQLKRIIKDNGCIVMTASQPFTTLLISSNIKMFKYEWIWDKIIPSGMSYARFQPMRQHENILIFYKNKIKYNAQMVKRNKSIKSGGQEKLNSESTTLDKYKIKDFKKIYNYAYPTTIINCNKVRKDSVHPTQKPVALMEYLIKTYSNESDLILDFAMGSCPTGVAAKKLNRHFIGIELNEKYFKIAKFRMSCID